VWVSVLGVEFRLVGYRSGDRGDELEGGFSRVSLEGGGE
jgi:hypothetical protein